MDSRGDEFGPYLVYEQIGVGGMASVHRAETTGIAGFRRPIALKRMLPHVAANDELVQSFVREARLASYLRHANVAQTYDLGKVGDIYFIAMELVPGRNLREILRQCLRDHMHVPIPIALNILAQVCDALDYAHNLTDDAGTPLGIIHRDVSPANVIVSDSGVVKLIDFGIAKASGKGMETLSGTIKGKFGYMAPEYLGGSIDARADLFALGVIAHELLTGRPLFGGRDDMDTLSRVRSMPIKPPSAFNGEVPREIDAIVMTALERDPDARWQRASALRVALTTETRRLGLTVLDQQVVDWCDELFPSKAPHDTVTSPAMARAERAVSTTPSIEIERDEPSQPGVASGARPAADPPDDDLASTRLRTSAQRGDRSRRPSGPRVLADPLSGSRTAPTLPVANPPPAHTLAIDSGDVLAEVDVTPAPMPAPLPAPLPAPTPAPTPAPLAAIRGELADIAPRPQRMRTWVLALLLLLTATASGAVVYFGLPYLR